VEHRHIAATHLIWPEEGHLPKEVVAYPIGNAGSSMLLSVLQEQMSQLVGR
jgi:hypothetical protein